ncbi:hypothetical protein D3869_25050 (plasmid) [Azospirillum brasilense]|uniref:Uncharacterized protein n=1 Tax=Azospirillum brasilense TaxID=192 RepID=A0A4D8R924_AZOBR|nr:hypothetical protein D3869_25050 [Azospirillum brasilense]
MRGGRSPFKGRQFTAEVILSAERGHGELWRFAKLRQCKCLNNMVEQDHRRVERLVQPGLGFRSFRTARPSLRATRSWS